MSAVRNGAALLAGLAVIAGGCGDSGGEDEGLPSRPAETADALPKLADGWTPHENPAGGFAFGLPPGWQARDRGTTTLVRSFDRLVAISISPDRTDRALALPPGKFATRVAEAIPAFDPDLDPFRPRPYEHRYDAAIVKAEGRAESTGVDQNLSAIVLRRRRIVTLTAIVTATAKPSAEEAREVARGVVRTLRSRPVAGATP